MFLEKDAKVHDLMLKQRRLVLPITVVTAAGDISSAAADGLVSAVCEVTADDTAAIDAIESGTGLNGTGLVANVLVHRLGVATQVLAVEAKDPDGGASQAVEATLTAAGNIAVEVTCDDDSTKTYALVVEYMVER